MTDGLLGLARFRWFAFCHSPLSQHRDPAIARLLLDAAIAEPESLLSRMGTTPQGLTAEEAAARLRIVGPNLIAHDRQQSPLAELIGRARNPLNFLLLSLAGRFLLPGRPAGRRRDHRHGGVERNSRLCPGTPIKRCCGEAARYGPHDRYGAATWR
jgi:Cation transporter/ATPase, N-terminus